MRKSLVVGALLLFGLLAYFALGWLDPGRQTPEKSRGMAPHASAPMASKELKQPLIPDALSNSERAQIEQKNQPIQQDQAVAEVAKGPMQLSVLISGPADQEPARMVLFKIHCALAEVTSAARLDEPFFLSLDPKIWHLGKAYRVSVSRGLHQSLFTGDVILAPNIRIQTKQHYTLRGWLVTNREQLQGETFVHARVPRSSPVQSELFAGMGSLNAKDEFRIEAWVGMETPTFRLAFGNERGFFGIVDVPTRQLTSAGGARVELELGRVTLQAIDEAGEPIAGVNVRLFSPMVEAQETWHTSTTDGDGMASFVLQSGSLEYCLGKRKHRFVSGTLEWDARNDSGPLQLRMPKLSPHESIGGRVLDSAGYPVFNAYVSAGPVTQNADLSVAANVNWRSDDEGRFRLSIAGNAPIEISAYRRDLGLTSQTLQASGQQDLILQFTPQGVLFVYVAQSLGAGTRPLKFDWLLKSHASGAVLEGTSSVASFLIEELPHGEYELWVREHSAQSIGHRSRVLIDAQQLEIELGMEQGHNARGRLLDTSGNPLSGASIQLLHWEHSTWGRSEIGMDGHFDLFLGVATDRLAKITDASGSVLAELKLSAGSHTYQLP